MATFTTLIGYPKNSYTYIQPSMTIYCYICFFVHLLSLSGPFNTSKSQRFCQSSVQTADFIYQLTSFSLVPLNFVLFSLLISKPSFRLKCHHKRWLPRTLRCWVFPGLQLWSSFPPNNLRLGGGVCQMNLAMFVNHHFHTKCFFQYLTNVGCWQCCILNQNVLKGQKAKS